MSPDASFGAFEAALFRPALQAARRDAARWKAKATISTLLELPPLRVPITNSSNEEKEAEDDIAPLLQLSSALANYRHQTASIKVVDITRPRDGLSPRSELFSMTMKKASASNELDKAAAHARQWLQTYQGSAKVVPEVSDGPLIGRVKFAGPDPIKTVSAPTNIEDLYRLQLQMFR